MMIASLEWYCPSLTRYLSNVNLWTLTMLLEADIATTVSSAL
jgi:hypothetical protein